MQKRRNQRSARLWPLLLIVPAALALLDLGRRAPAPATRASGPQGDADQGPPARTQAPARRLRSQGVGRVETPQLDRAPSAPSPPAPARRVDPCGGVSPYGTCAGHVATACVDGRVMTVDCAATGERCVMTREGASCLPSRGAEVDCSPADPAVCDGDVLRHCVDGAWQDIDCAMRLAHCAAGAGRAQCVATPAAAAAPGAPGGKRDAVETCDGEDQDRDGAIDEAGVCDEIALVAFVPSGGRLRDLEARMQDELAIVNRVFHPLTFGWRQIVETPQVPRSFHPRMFGELAAGLSRADPAAQPTSTPAEGDSAFYIPVLFVESIGTSPPKAGMSTLPNARCGGVRISDLPALAEGLIVVSEVRQPETLAHELGHYLGLCHTHEELAAYGLAAGASSQCDGTGDGICDTAFDPGPPQCAELYTCASHCEGIAAEPDTSNVMSYYMMCRRGLSAQQLAEVERNLSLRRGWFRCLDPHACPCMPGEAATCPVEMSCQPARRPDAPGECALDGPALPGAPCRHLGDCADGSICLGARDDESQAARCARACLADAEGCTCTDVGLAFRACREDLE